MAYPGVVIYVGIVAVASVVAAVVGFMRREDPDVIGSYALGTAMVVGIVVGIVHLAVTV